MAEMSALIFFLCVRQQRDRKWPRMHLASRIRTGSFVGKNGDPTKRERTSVDMISGWLAAAGGWRLAAAAGGWRRLNVFVLLCMAPATSIPPFIQG